jgi:hypothetical protein
MFGKIIHWLEKNYFIAIFIMILVGGGIFYVSSLTFESGPRSSSWKPIAYHISVFFLFSFFLLISLVRGKRKMFIYIGLCIGILYGILDEIHQFFVPGRACSLFDVLLDSTGVLLACIFYLVYMDGEK